MSIIHPRDFRAIHALEAQNRRPGDVLKDGERLHSNVNLIDSAADGERRLTDAERASIDATVRAKVEEAAKEAGMKASEWLASATPRQIERIVESAARAHVTALGGEGIAKGFALDCMVRSEVDRAQAIHDHKFSFLGSKAPRFNRANAEVIARNRLTTIANASDRSKAIAAARYQDAASLPNVLPGHVSGASLTGDAATAAHNASMAQMRRARYTKG